MRKNIALPFLLGLGVISMRTIRFIRLFFHCLLIFCLIGMASEVWADGGKKLMTVRKAKAVAQRALVESVIGLKLHSNELWTNTSASDQYQVTSETAARLQGVVFDTPKYDSAKDIAMVTAKIRLGEVQNIIGKPVAYQDVVIARVGFATSSPQFAPQLQALRAAELNAYDEMARLLVGQEISGKAKMRNFILESDEVRTKTQAALWGAEIADFGWEPDGTAYVKLVLNAKWVSDILGRASAAGVYEVTGYGATHDDGNVPGETTENANAGRQAAPSP